MSAIYKVQASGDGNTCRRCGITFCCARCRRQHEEKKYPESPTCIYGPIYCASCKLLYLTVKGSCQQLVPVADGELNIPQPLEVVIEEEDERDDVAEIIGENKETANVTNELGSSPIQNESDCKVSPDEQTTEGFGTVPSEERRKSRKRVRFASPVAKIKRYRRTLY